MKITVEVSSIKELRDFVFQSGYLVAEERIEQAGKAAKASAKYDEKPATVKEDPAPEPALAETAEPEAKESDTPAAEVTAADIRALGREVNLKAGTNLVKDWLKELGYKSLAEVKKTGDLTTLKEKAEAYLAE